MRQAEDNRPPPRFFINWFRDHGRDFPWRKTDSKFALLTAEILLKQTQASRVSPVWKELTERYPTPSRMASAPIGLLEETIRTLGFGVQRATGLKTAATYLVDKHRGVVPRTLSELEQIPFLGMYSSRALFSFGFRKRVAIVDTNVLRIVSRYSELAVTNPDVRRNAAIWAEATNWLPRTGEAACLHNYGLLDFAAEICSVTPKCNKCPLRPGCHWGLTHPGARGTFDVT